ncbi:MAG TPA: polysaccharide deacetylase family protein [Flavisolibacter sp.]|nr:polysaccharide deacetylase family protein [Flavisolibacter sp.]
MQKSRLFFCLLWLATLFFAACRKDLHGSLPSGQLALTFDDASVDNWYQHLDLLDSLKIKATFYVSSYHTFSSEQKQKLREIERHGHEVAYHTATHPDLVKEVAKNGMAQTEAREISSDLALLKADGYNITNFAYPYGSHSIQLDKCLLRRFKSVRALSNQQNYDKSLVKESGDWKVLYGANVDNNSRLKNDGILSLMDKAKEHNDCLVMVAHQINNPSLGLQITKERLILISRAAAERSMEFVTINRIAK